MFFFFFFFNDTATTEIYTLSLHDALPISPPQTSQPPENKNGKDPSIFLTTHYPGVLDEDQAVAVEDRKSTRLNSSHLVISYAVFCLKKKKIKKCTHIKFTSDNVNRLTHYH